MINTPGRVYSPTCTHKMIQVYANAILYIIHKRRESLTSRINQQRSIPPGPILQTAYGFRCAVQLLHFMAFLCLEYDVYSGCHSNIKINSRREWPVVSAGPCGRLCTSRLGGQRDRYRRWRWWTCRDYLSCEQGIKYWLVVSFGISICWSTNHFKYSGEKKKYLRPPTRLVWQHTSADSRHQPS